VTVKVEKRRSKIGDGWCIYIVADTADEYNDAVLDATRGFENVHANGADRCLVRGRIIGMVRAWKPRPCEPTEDHD
jgi:hypothetical protein